MGQRPNQQHHRTEAWTMVTSTTSRANPTGLSSLKRKTKKISIYSTVNTEDTEVLGIKQDQSPIQSTDL